MTTIEFLWKMLEQGGYFFLLWGVLYYLLFRMLPRQAKEHKLIMEWLIKTFDNNIDKLIKNWNTFNAVLEKKLDLLDKKIEEINKRIILIDERTKKNREKIRKL